MNPYAHALGGQYIQQITACHLLSSAARFVRRGYQADGAFRAPETLRLRVISQQLGSTAYAEALGGRYPQQVAASVHENGEVLRGRAQANGAHAEGGELVGEGKDDRGGGGGGEGGGQAGGRKTWGKGGT